MITDTSVGTVVTIKDVGFVCRDGIARAITVKMSMCTAENGTVRELKVPFSTMLDRSFIDMEKEDGQFLLGLLGDNMVTYANIMALKGTSYMYSRKTDQDGKTYYKLVPAAL